MSVDHIHWLGHASFRIEDGAAQIYIDPWKVPAKAPNAPCMVPKSNRSCPAATGVCVVNTACCFTWAWATSCPWC